MIMSTENDEFDLKVTKDFIKENIESYKYRTLKKGGPYNKKDRLARRNEVYRLHFEYGYFAVKIAEIMGVNRNTINGDIDYWYSKINSNIFNPEQRVLANIERLESQRTRLREELDRKTESQEKIALERLIYEVDSKILQICFKLGESSHRIHKLATNWLNDFLKKKGKDERYMTFLDTISVSEKARQRIRKIINEDKGKARR